MLIVKNNIKYAFMRKRKSQITYTYMENLIKNIKLSLW